MLRLKSKSLCWGRLMSSLILPGATSEITSDVRTPVKLRELAGPSPEASVAAQTPPMKVQEMMRNTVDRFPGQRALGIKRGGQWIYWNYEQVKLSNDSITATLQTFSDSHFVYPLNNPPLPPLCEHQELLSVLKAVRCTPLAHGHC